MSSKPNRARPHPSYPPPNNSVILYRRESILAVSRLPQTQIIIKYLVYCSYLKEWHFLAASQVIASFYCSTFVHSVLLFDSVLLFELFSVRLLRAFSVLILELYSRYFDPIIHIQQPIVSQ
jgi:hypothetical protein